MTRVCVVYLTINTYFYLDLAYACDAFIVICFALRSFHVTRWRRFTRHMYFTCARYAYECLHWTIDIRTRFDIICDIYRRFDWCICVLSQLNNIVDASYRFSRRCRARQWSIKSTETLKAMRSWISSLPREMLLFPGNCYRLTRNTTLIAINCAAKACAAASRCIKQ